MIRGKPDLQLGQTDQLSLADKYDNNPLFESVSDQPEMFGMDRGGETIVAGGISQAFKKTLKEAAEIEPPVIKPALEMSAEAVERRKEILERNKIDIELPEKAGNINLKYMDAPDKVNQVIADLADMMPEKVEAARGGVQTWEQTKLLADELQLTPEQLINRKQGEAWNAQSIYAARMMLAQARDDVDALAKKINAREASSQDLIEFRRMVSVYAGIQQQVHGLAAEAGRALNQFKIMGQSGELRKRQIDAMMDNYGHASTERMAQLWGALDDPHQKAKLAMKAHEAKGIDMVLEYWINALLSAPSTHAVNILGNSLTAMWGIAEKGAAIGVGQVRMRLFGGERGVAPSELVAEVYGLQKGSMDGLKMAWQVLKTREPSDPLSKMEARKHQAITGENVTSLVNKGIRGGGKAASWMLGRKKVTPAELEASGWLGRGADAMGSFIRYPGVALMAEDEFFKSVAYRMELNALAARQAYREGLSGEEAATRIAAILDDPPENIQLAATDHKHYRTFTAKLGYMSSLQRLMAEAPAFRFIMPFVRTPINITKYSFERIPGLNLLMKQTREQLFSPDPATRDVAMGKLAMGTMFMTAAMPFVAEHFDNSESDFEITGAAPSDNALKGLWKRTHQEYSIRIGDEWYAYNRADPLGQILGIMADSVRIMRNADEDTLDEFGPAIVYAISNNLINKTYMSGVAEFFDTFTSFDKTKWERYMKRMGASFMPNIVRRAETQIDPTVRVSESLIEEFCARVPGCSASLPPMRNVWGEPIESRAYGPEFISPIFNMRNKYSAIDKELERLKFPISMPSKFIGDVKMNARQYSDYTLLQGKTVRMRRGSQFADISISGLNMKEALEKLVTKSMEYNRGTDYTDPPGIKAKLIRGLTELYREQAKFHMYNRYPELLDAAAERQVEKANANGYTPFDAAQMGIEYKANMRNALPNLNSRVDEGKQ